LQGFTLLVRGTPGAGVIGAVRREISAMDANLTVFNARGMAEQIDTVAYPSRVAMWTCGGMGLFGAILAAVALAACYTPARKSLRINPAATLRQE
jgi:ABC-type lipoprotein release transport system permease subunit